VAPSQEPSPRWLRVLVLLGVLALGGFLRWTTLAEVADLRPWPDAIEYEEAARNLHDGRGYLLWIGGDAYPPRYPPGFSLLIAASLPLVGSALGSGIYAVLASALAAIAAAYVLARRTGGFASGVVAALLVATSPLHVQWSRAVMSDVPASAALAWLAVWVLAAVGRDAGLLEHLLLGAACALVASIRQPLLLVVPAAGLVILLFSPGAAVTRGRKVLALGAGVVLGALPLLCLNAALFGSPLRNGYDYWVHGQQFALSWAFAPRASGAPANAWYYGTLLLGGGALYPWTATILLLAGTVMAWRGSRAARALATLGWLFTALFFLFHLPYFWQWDRFFLPLLPLLAALMALPCGRGTNRLVRGAALALVAATLLLAGTLPDAYAPPNPPAYDVATLVKLAAIVEPNAAVLARSTSFFFARTLRHDGDRVWVPLLPDPHQRAIAHDELRPLRHEAHAAAWIRPPLTMPFDPAAALGVVEELCREGRPVYLSEQLELHVPFLRELKEALAARFTLTQVVAPDPYAVQRVECPGR